MNRKSLFRSLEPSGTKLGTKIVMFLSALSHETRVLSGFIKPNMVKVEHAAGVTVRLLHTSKRYVFEERTWKMDTPSD